MSCGADFYRDFIAEIEWLVKDRCGDGTRCKGGLKPCEKPVTTSSNEPYAMNVTLDVFVKLHQMLRNFIDRLDFRKGPSCGSSDRRKIPPNEALDVAVRALVSAMQSSDACKLSSSTPACLNCPQNSKCMRRQSVDVDSKCDLDKLPEIAEVDERLHRLKELTLENVEKIERYIKDVLRAVVKLPSTVMTSRLAILSSVVRNTKNKMISCGRSNSASLMGIQVNPIYQIISEFILEYGQIKSEVFPCRKVCRFCGSIICPMDRKRGLFCCENAKHLNYLRKQWNQQNSVKGVAKWDEDTITSIVDSLRSTSAGDKKHFAEGHSSTVYGTGTRNREDARENNRQGSAEFSEGGTKKSHFSEDKKRDTVDGDNRRGSLSEEARRKDGRLGTGERRDSKDIDKNNRSRGNERYENKGRGLDEAHASMKRSAGADRGVREISDVDKRGRKKGSRKDGPGGDMNDEDDDLGKGGRRKNRGSGRRDRRRSEGENEEHNRGGKVHRKKGGRLRNDGSDPETGNAGEPGGPTGSTKKGRGKVSGIGERDGEGSGDMKSARKGNGNRTSGGGPESTGFDGTDGKGNAGMKTREKYLNAPEEVGGSAEGREVKSGDRTQEDGENIIRYRLSNELFVELGWTLLPKDTVMRRVVEFESLAAKPHMNWLRNNRLHGKQYYADNKTIFSNFFEDGSGRVFYPNGQTAIAAQISKKSNHELYKVYAPGGRDVMGVMRLPWLMGVFDSMGNGVVYNENCDTRLTYNQNGGVFIDTPAKVPFSWGWNNFQTFPIDEAVYLDPPAHEIFENSTSPRRSKSSDNKSARQLKSSETTTSEQQTLNDEQDASESQKSKGFEPVKVVPKKIVTPVKPICLKMNKYLSLRILDRKNINLQFFAGPKCIRIELGTEVNPNVQISSELVDRDYWTAKMTKSRFDVNVNRADVERLSPDDSVVEIAEELQRVQKEANSRQLMIAKYRPHLIDP